MTDGIELFSDGDGLAVIGDLSVVERFLTSAGLTSKDLGLDRVGSLLADASGVAHAASGITAASGRWVQLSEKSAHLVANSRLMTGSSPDLARAMATRSSGEITDLLEIVKSSATLVTNPAVLAGIAGVMAQLAMKQSMDEITEYLAVIDAKIDDVRRAQKDAALADVIAVGLVIDEALTIREDVGRVSEVTWSKVQTSSMAIARAQAYALRRLDALADEIERASNGRELAKATKKAERDVAEWLAVLARCFQLEDGVGVLELDRILDGPTGELERHRIGLRNARRKRRALISTTTERLVARMDTRAGAADAKVLLSPFATPAAIRSTNLIASDVVRFHGLLGIEDARQAREPTKWLDAAEDFRDDLLGAGAEGVDAAVKIGIDTLDRARALTNRIASDVAERTRRADGPD